MESLLCYVPFSLWAPSSSKPSPPRHTEPAEPEPIDTRHLTLIKERWMLLVDHGKIFPVGNPSLLSSFRPLPFLFPFFSQDGELQLGLLNQTIVIQMVRYVILPLPIMFLRPVKNVL
mmetsp:Transcript_24979/g.34454  ORF Transcript_24979/g.34454 Transcript_24979/m.34454 type:complete len:117 (+) Transcript_24979:1539-1889(+)